MGIRMLREHASLLVQHGAVRLLSCIFLLVFFIAYLFFQSCLIISAKTAHLLVDNLLYARG